MRSFTIVAVGGAVGTLARHGINESLASDRLFPLATFTVNISGAFLLGLLITALAAPDDEHTGRRRDARLLLGTGLLGGFTTYSTLAVETDALLRDDHLGLALAYGAGSAVIGLAAALAGAITARVAMR